MYSNFLLKVGSTEIPNKYISRGTYKATANKQVVHQYTDANGDDHIEVLPHRKLSVSLSVSDCDAKVYNEVMQIIRNAFVNSTEERLLVTAYVPGLDKYVSQYCQLQDDSPTVFDAKSGRLIYQGINISFEGYGGEI